MEFRQNGVVSRYLDVISWTCEHLAVTAVHMARAIHTLELLHFLPQSNLLSSYSYNQSEQT